MKNNILKVLAISTFAIVVLFNISLNGKLKAGDTNLIQQAQADNVICAEYYGGWSVCCILSPGACTTGWGNFYGPIYMD